MAGATGEKAAVDETRAAIRNNFMVAEMGLSDVSAVAVIEKDGKARL